MVRHTKTDAGLDSETAKTQPYEGGKAATDSGTQDALFHAIANFTYDWESWMGLDGRPHWINPAVERITGYSADECLAMEDYPLSIIHPDDRTMIVACLERAGNGESGNDVEFRISSKTGKNIWGAVSWQTIYDNDNKRIGYRTSVRDITERKHTEQALRAAQYEAEMANAAKSHFLAAASHDLRQPIQAANMFVSALTKVSAPEEQQHILSAIRDSLNATETLLGALLDVSRLDAGVMEPTLSDFPAADILEQLEVEFEALVLDKNLTFLALPSSLSVRTDPILLLRILRNFVSNAIRYTNAGRILIGTRRLATHLRFEVWDTGIGIDPAKIDEIFDDFRQLNNPERDRNRGLGLGLAIVKRKAKLLDLPISVRSTLGKGSVFSITVPLAEGNAQSAKDRTKLPIHYDLSGIRVLYIDDDKIQLKAMELVLDQWGSLPMLATSAENAIYEIRQQGFIPDIIIADYRLRDNNDGASAICDVCIDLGESVPAIILTGDTEPKRIVEATASGYVLLHKPVSADFLKETLFDVLATRKN